MKRIIVFLLALSSVLTPVFFTGCANGDLPPEAIKEYPECSQAKMDVYRAIYQETGLNPVIESTYDAEAKIYTNVKVNAYLKVGFDHYYIMSQEEFQSIQKYQDETGIQVIYPLVSVNDRPTKEKNKYDANIYYQVENPKANTVRPKLDQNGNFMPNAVVRWTTTNAVTAFVNNGSIFAIAPGSAVITATVEGTAVSANCFVVVSGTVLPPEPQIVPVQSVMLNPPQQILLLVKPPLSPQPYFPQTLTTSLLSGPPPTQQLQPFRTVR